MCVLGLCVFTEQRGYTQKTVLAVIFGIEAAMFYVTAECKEAGRLRSALTVRLRSSNPQEKASTLRERRVFSLSVAEGKGTQDQPSARQQRSKYTRECNTTASICKCSAGPERRHPGSCCRHCS